MKVGIIGGGAAGLVTAWLLDQECEVILFEKEQYLGGHAHTHYVEISGSKIPIEMGFEFFNSWLFPNFCQLLSCLKVPIHTYPLTYTYFTEKDSYPLSLIRERNICWKMFAPHRLLTLLQMLHVVRKGKKIAFDERNELAIEQFIESLFLTKSFKEEFFYPLLAAGWGGSLHDFKSFAAYDIFTWFAQKLITLRSPYWSEIAGGTTTYINALVNQLRNTTMRLNSVVENITFNNNNYVIYEANGNKTVVDHLVIATDPQQAYEYTKNISHAKKINALLMEIEPFPTKIAVHGDERWMPKNKDEWSVANVRYTGDYSAMTIYKKWKSDVPLFRSWITHVPDSEIAMVQPLYAIKEYQHQKVTPQFFKIQRALRSLQGNNKLWFAGHYMHTIDSHESAVVSAINVAQKIVSKAERFEQLLNASPVILRKVVGSL